MRSGTEYGIGPQSSLPHTKHCRCHQLIVASMLRRMRAVFSRAMANLGGNEMRVLAGLIVVAGLTSPICAAAQTARNTPDGIICAVTGVCSGGQAAGDDRRINIGNEKAFSLARPSGATPPATTKPAPVLRSSAATRPTPAPRRVVAARRTVRPAIVHPGGGLDMLVNFNLNSATLTPQAQAEARAFAQAMTSPQLNAMRFAIEGHTDASGSRDRNLDLSQRRAQAVVDYLVQLGVDPSRLAAKGRGPDQPLPGKPSSSPSNRRVEFIKQG